MSPEWLAEIQRRSAVIDAGTAKLIPREQVYKEALQRLEALNHSRRPKGRLRKSGDAKEKS
jgi:hypothetical protein